MRNKKAKQINRQAREIAEKFPVVMTRVLVYGIDGRFRKPIGVAEVESNHVRRIRRAFVRHGIEGLHNYMDSINKLQKQRNEELTKEVSDSK